MGGREVTKKDIKIVIFLIAFGYAILNYHSFFPKELPDYERVNSFSLTIGDYHNVKLNYVVHKRLDDKNLYKEIEAEHNRMDGKPTELEIKLYASMDEWKNGGDAYMEVFFDYENNTSHIIKRNPYKKSSKK